MKQKSARLIHNHVGRMEFDYRIQILKHYYIDEKTTKLVTIISTCHTSLQ